MISKGLVEKGFDFSKTTGAIQDAFNFLQDNTANAGEDNQKLEVIDYNIWIAAKSLYPTDPAVIEMKKERKNIDSNTSSNDGFNTITDNDPINHSSKPPLLNKVKPKKNNQKQVSSIPKTKNTPFAVIKKIIDEKGENFKSYTLEDKEAFLNFEGIGGKEKSGTGILDQFFTPEFIAKQMYSLAKKHGFKDSGLVLEPASGSGRFIQTAPKESKVVAFEVDKYNYIISKVLYPKATIFNKYFETAFLQPPRYTTKYDGSTPMKDYPFSPTKESWLGQFDLVIGNPPYGSHKTLYSSYFTKSPKQLDIFFLLYGLKLLKSGGLLVFITSSGFLRNGNSLDKVKEDILKIATFVDAYRMPNNLFANTKVGTDIIIFKRK